MTRNIRERFHVARWMAARLSGIINEQEAAALDNWLARSPLHAREWEEIRQAVERGEIKRARRREVSRAWRRFEQKTPGQRRPLRRWWGRAAAALVLLAAGSYAWYRAETRPAERVPPPAWEELTPGMANALLVMDDGVTVELLPDRDTLIRGEQGMTVATESRAVIYPPETAIPDESANLYHTLIVTRGAEFSLRLPDSTRVWLNAGSRLRYPVRFADDTREVELDGEGYFEVESAARRAFVVKVEGIDIRVLGTRFNVSSHDDQVVTTLLEGKVKLTKGNEEVTLLPDQQAIMERGGDRFTVRCVTARDFTLWKEGVFWFEDAELGAIMERVARWYDATLVYQDPAIKKLRFSMEMKRYENIRAVLRKMEQTRKVKFTLSGQTIYITR
jgi:ferric-dicitrate binding protein FerR (iron transport regulator)